VLKVVGEALSVSPSGSVSLASNSSPGTVTLLDSTLVMTWSSTATGGELGITFTVSVELARSPSLSLRVKPMFSVITVVVVFCEAVVAGIEVDHQRALLLVAMLIVLFTVLNVPWRLPLAVSEPWPLLARGS
jgi:hypothetical protein